MVTEEQVIEALRRMGEQVEECPAEVRTRIEEALREEVSRRAGEDA